MKKEVSPAIMIAIIAAAVVLVGFIGFKVLGSNSHQDMTHTKAYENHEKAAGHMSTLTPPGGAPGNPADLSPAEKIRQSHGGGIAPPTTAGANNTPGGQ